MGADLMLEVLYGQRLVYSDSLTERIELGRLKGAEPKSLLFATQSVSGGHRVAIVESNENSVSREHVWIQPVSENKILITNVSKGSMIQLDNEKIEAGQSRELEVPTRFYVGAVEIRIQEQPKLRGFAPSSITPGKLAGSLKEGTASTLIELSEEQASQLSFWVESIVGVLQSAASSADFYQQAAQAIVQLIGLDSGRVLLRQENSWYPRAMEISQTFERQPVTQPSSKILSSLLRDKRTVWGNPGQSMWDQAASLTNVQAVVVSPIMDRYGEVIGALYGDRRMRFDGKAQIPQITNVEAMLVKILAASIGAGLARAEQEQMAKQQEQAALAARTRFAQFFTPELSDRLAADPDMLKGRDTEVTLLFCDIRGFSRISQRLDPAVTMDWIGDVIGALSDCVIDHHGVLVDYVGDELLAMWGAPTEQPDQALLAARAAVAMHDSLPLLNHHWQERMGEPLCIGIGINTGIARVGNIGSQRKLKYGPLGNTVNLASRVQGISKYVKSEILLTAATHARLNSEFATRRLGGFRVVNITGAVEIYELRPHGDAGGHPLQEGFEGALRDFEQKRFRQSAEMLEMLIGKYPQDGPSRLLQSRVVELLSSGAETGTAWDPAWILPGK